MTQRAQFTQKGRAMRDRIVATAADLVFKSGAQETSLDEVREKVGASKSQLYHYFSDKDDLLRAVIEFQGLRVIQAQQPELPEVNSFEALRRWRDKLVQLADAHGAVGGCPIGSLANELASQNQSHRSALAAQFASWLGEIKSAFTAMRENGTISPELDPNRLSLLFLSAIQGGLLFAKLHGSPAVLAASLDQLIALIEMDGGPSRRVPEGRRALPSRRAPSGRSKTSRRTK